MLFGYFAAVTERIKFMPSVMVLPIRQTALVAKQAAEVDVLSGGRLILGIGVGWSGLEFEAMNEDFRTRGRRAEEQIDLMAAALDRAARRLRGPLSPASRAAG